MAAGALVTRKEAEKLLKREKSSRARLRKVREEARGPIRTIVHSVETVGAGFGFGFINGYWDGAEILGAPVDLVSGFGLHVLGFVMDDDMSPHLHALGNGALTSFAVTFGQGAGVEAAERAEGGGTEEEIEEVLP